MITRLPQPVSIEESEDGMIVIHRPIFGTHVDSRDCWCHPHLYAPAEVQLLTADQLNQLLELDS